MPRTTSPRFGRGRRLLLIAGAATIAIAIAIGGVWWGAFRVPHLSETDGGGRFGASPTPDRATQPARPSATTTVGPPSVPSAGGTTAPERTQSPLVAAVGRIDALEGEVRITSKSGERAAQAGLDVIEGDIIRTGANAWALLEMTDGATITVRPNTQARIDTYRYAPDGAASENRSVIGLAKGALRVITGLIGQTNRRGYSISTPGATIGIRGTDHEPSYYPPGDADLAGQSPGTYDKVNAGETVIRNPRGEVAVRPGRAAFVHHDARLAPQLLAREPVFYRRHAESDKPVAARRTEIHRRIERERLLRPKPPAAMLEKKGPQQLRQERLKEQAQKRANEKGAKSQPKTGGAQPKTPQQLQQERLREQAQKRANEKGARPQPRTGGAQPKTPQQLQQERLREQAQKRANEKGARPQPRTDGAQPKTPQQLQQERAAAEAKARKK